MRKPRTGKGEDLCEIRDPYSRRVDAVRDSNVCGGVDANGCHYERSTGRNWQDTYHCHEQKPANSDTAAAVKVGQTAPDFQAPGATRYGLLANPVSLSDFSGKTVVLAFFYKARTKG